MLQKNFTTETRSFSLVFLSVSVTQWFKKVCYLFLTTTEFSEFLENFVEFDAERYKSN
jgi:hypothetical protein